MNILTIALNTFREAVRNKIFYTLIFFALILVGFSISFSTMILGSYTHLIINMGLANIEIFGTMIAIFVGVSLVYKELQQRTIYTIITRPIQRSQFILGKYFGLILTILVEIFIMSIVFLIIIALYGEAYRIPDLMIAIWLIFLKVALITSVAVLFSSVSTPILSGMFTLAFYLIGSSSTYLSRLVDGAPNPFFGAFIRLLMFLLPDFSFIDIKGQVVYEKALNANQIFGGSAYALLYISIVLLLSILIFDRKDMK